MPEDVECSGIDHVQLAMPAGREDEAHGFYAYVPGLREVPKPPGATPADAPLQNCERTPNGLVVALVSEQVDPSRRCAQCRLDRGDVQLVDCGV